MTTLWNSFKAIFNSSEAQEFKKDLHNTSKHITKKVEKTTKRAVEKVSGTSQDNILTFDDFLKVEMRVGTILSAEEVEKSDKLLLLSVDLGEEKSRTIVSGIKKHFKTTKELVGTQAVFVTNLPPRAIFGHESQGMIMALGDGNNFSLLRTEHPITPGTRVS